MVDPQLVFDRLFRRFGPQHWWPAETPFEIVVGALLMAQTSWRNVEKSIDGLKGADLLDPRALAHAPLRTVGKLVKPAGLYQQKPLRLRNFCRHLLRVTDGDLDRFLGEDLDEARRELLTLDGVGPETADSILLYAGGFPTFVVDAYTVRIGRRLGWFKEDRYASVKAFFESHVPRDLARYREYHALLVAHGRQICRPKPRCSICPLQDVCAYYRPRKPPAVRQPSNRPKTANRSL